MGLVDALGLGVILSYKERMSSQTKVASRSLKKLEKDATNVTNAIERQAERAGQMVEKYRGRMVSAFKIAAGGIALTLPFLKMNQIAAQSEQRLNDVESLLRGMGLTAEETAKHMATLENEIDRIVKLGTITPFAELEGTAAYILTSALGIEVATKILDDTNKLAVAGKGSIEEASRLLTATVATFGKNMDPSLTVLEKGKKITEAYASTIAAFNTELEPMARAMQFAAGPASKLGVSLKEVATVIGAAQTAGLVNTLAGTGFNAYLREVVKIKDKFNTEAKKDPITLFDFIDSADKSGEKRKLKPGAGLAAQLKLEDAEGRLLPFFDILKQIENRYESAKNEAGEFALKTAQAAEIQAVFGEEGSRVILATLGQAAAIKEIITGQKELSSLEAMVASRQKGQIARYEILKNRATRQAKTIGDLLIPAMMGLIRIASRVMAWMEKFIQMHPDATKWIVWGTSIAGILIMVGGLIAAIVFKFKMLAAMRTLAFIATDGKAAQTVLWRLGNSMLMLRARLLLIAITTKLVAAAQWIWNAAMTANPIGLIIVGVAALIAGIILLVNNWDWVVQKWNQGIEIMKSLWESLKTTVKNVWDWIYSKILSVVDTIMNNPIVKAFMSMFEGALDFGKELFGVGGSDSASSAAAPIPEIVVPVLAGAPGVDYEDLTTPSAFRMANEQKAQSKNTFHFTINPQKGQNPKEIAKEVMKIADEKEARSKDGQF